ncbi:MAG: acyl-CoA thioesterase [Anaerolineales bacterium]|nr:acyl-CoA thioesterase [Anaerolineales bacterium]MCX7608721.1 acyl-CoA thioesterase [Anaerolineales bacterium]MDW8226712.1 acyl-CoA thioesterase [Anaerolineales bacterium]
MTNQLLPKPVSASRIQLAQMMQPEHANTQGNVHGGWIMKLVDEAGALAATRHAGHRTVTVAMDQMVFRHPIHIGDLVILNAQVTYAGRTSMEVEVRVTAENPLTGERRETNTAYLVYVAIDEQGRPTPVPPLLTETPEEEARMRAAQERQQRRLQQKQEMEK